MEGTQKPGRRLRGRMFLPAVEPDPNDGGVIGAVKRGGPAGPNAKAAVLVAAAFDEGPKILGFRHGQLQPIEQTHDAITRFKVRNLGLVAAEASIAPKSAS